MQEFAIDDAQRRYARLAGVMYLLNYATSVFGAIVPPRIAGAGELADQARRISASEHLYRGALASMAIGWVLIVVLAFSLYITLKPVSRRIAQLALLLEVAQAAVGAVTVMFSFAALRIYTAVSQPGSIQNEQLQAVVRALDSGGLSGFQISMMFLGAGSTLFFYLFYKSGYIPRALAALGVVGSALMIAVSVSILIFPNYANQLQLGWAPIGLAEVGTALWLTFVGIRAAPARVSQIAAA
jgi:hypothetical protein